MSMKECTHHKERRRKIIRRAFSGGLIFLFVVLLTILLVWAILQPTKPTFVLQEATIFNFNLSAPNILSTTIQVTVIARNPNSHVGVYYDQLRAYATYHDQQITFYADIPPVYQGHKGVNVWSPFVYGSNVPIAPFNGHSLTLDRADGAVLLTVRIIGRVKWRVGTVVTGHYHLRVTCEAYIPFGVTPRDGVGNAVKYQIARSCGVSV